MIHMDCAGEDFALRKRSSAQLPVKGGYKGLAARVKTRLTRQRREKQCSHSQLLEALFLKRGIASSRLP